MNTNMRAIERVKVVFTIFCFLVLVLWKKVASALEVLTIFFGLTSIGISYFHRAIFSNEQICFSGSLAAGYS